MNCTFNLVHLRDGILNCTLKMIKLRHYFANKGPSCQGYGFSSSHGWMWELDVEL